MRVILFTGKGGVGKTTIAAASAMRVAELGHKTLVVSTDAAHSLGDSFDVKLGNSPTKVADKLWAQEVNVLEEIAANWKTVQEYMASFFKSRGVEDILAEEMAVLPGMDELFGLLHLHRAKQTNQYDCVIVDCAPTGQTLRLLSLPEVSRWWMQKIFPVERKVAKTLRMMRKKTILTIPVPDDALYASIQELFDNIGALKELLADPKKTSVRIVLNPEKIILEETQRAYTYLNLYGYPVDCVIANRILPDEVTDSYFSSWRKTQSKYMSKIESVFSPLPVLKSKLMRSEIVGTKRLSRVGKYIYGSDDPSKIYYDQIPQQVITEQDGYVLVIQLPFVKKAGLDILRNEDQLTVRIGNYRREILLPATLSLLQIGKAKLESNELRIAFVKGE
ncbi:MAG: TRC40/GET3/ArsA family transport-energizing ATPase [Phycisphaerae bacterium]|nr:TRC40/GET3/ArsA family transport-energizing ATPase [Phycisphaerae bacterium]NIP52935.1 TRC40/GET3/ArsA family transport-energizing ATPase [Phycisphaerae bacterium]NIS51986.1 TRC40/GET3/ArsA family transport-energizing ATPase [Phycisphaerae bacterium]NIU09500.1 TRC40/GET3/ArsA family transport-energizing ATPase [Phycisphaerae bacterium]NIU58151.1 TRC40/GET3/ArsA family transport-energizing ATPase [Phycisphaerae bacterium]